MELWDIYDKNKKPTGRTMKRNDWHLKDGEYHLTVLGVVAREDGTFLITKRVMTKAWAPGWWEVSGGAAQAGEASYDAVLREVKEETGLDVINGHVVYSYFNEDQKRHDNYFVDIYHFKFDFQLSDVTLNTRESIDCRCVSLDELVAMNNEDEFLHFERIMKALQQKK